jgi:tryptophanyl-tRNA synthetase
MKWTKKTAAIKILKMTEKDVKEAINETSDTVNRETDWLEALTARLEQINERGQMLYAGELLYEMTKEQLIDIIAWYEQSSQNHIRQTDHEM